jgi:hypothetical protein
MALFKHKEFFEHSDDAAFDTSTYHQPLLYASTQASVKMEMAKPRMAKSARIAEQNLVTRRISQRRAIVARLMNRPTQIT